MENRYTKIILRADKGVTFSVKEEQENEMIIELVEKGVDFSLIQEKDKELIIQANGARKYFRLIKSHSQVPIPEGYSYLTGTVDTGFVITRDKDGSQFVWIPVASLEGNNKLLRRNDKKSECSVYKNSEDDIRPGGAIELLQQLQSVNKYGGFYVSCYHISQTSSGEFLSIGGKIPHTGNEYLMYERNEWFSELINAAQSFENTETVKSHLLFGCEYDTMIEWLIQSGQIEREYAWNPLEFCKYNGPKDNMNEWLITMGKISREVAQGQKQTVKIRPSIAHASETGKLGHLNHIYDMNGNVRTLTQECWRYPANPVCRGGLGYDCLPMGERKLIIFTDIGWKDVGYRVALWLK